LRNFAKVNLTASDVTLRRNPRNSNGQDEALDGWEPQTPQTPEILYYLLSTLLVSDVSSCDGLIEIVDGKMIRRGIVIGA
jgi:hypothetical protein